jgi:hypothetical protein
MKKEEAQATVFVGGTGPSRAMNETKEIRDRGCLQL